MIITKILQALCDHDKGLTVITEEERNALGKIEGSSTYIVCSACHKKLLDPITYNYLVLIISSMIEED